MSLVRRLVRSTAAHRLVREVIIWYIRTVRITSTWRVEGTEPRDRLFAQGRPFIIALWHNRIAMMPYAWEEETRNLTVMASAHRDGRLVIEGLGRFGFSAIPVDSKQGGSGPTRQVLRLLRDGRRVGITPDGPRGPRMRLRGGMIQIAMMAQTPIVPVAYGMSRRKLLRSWDRFLLPLPFARGVCLWGEPIEPPPRGDAEAFERVRRTVERRLTELGDECDRRCGVRPIAPAPLDEPEDRAAPRAGAQEVG